MLEARLKTNSLSAVFSLGLILIFCCSFSVYSSLRAHLFYRQAVSLEKPSLRLGLEGYYREVIFLTSRAIGYAKTNADYLVKKADYISEALSDGFSSQLALGEKDAEKFYLKAVELNPVNFEYHLKLGWFYVNQGDERGKGELIKATKLHPKQSRVYSYLAEYYSIKGQEDELIKAAARYPQEPQIYLSLAKYYLRESNDKKAFINLILFLHHEKNSDARYEIIKEIEETVKESTQVFLDLEKRKVKFTIQPQAGEFDFKKESFPHQKIPLSLYIYVRNPADEVTIYRDEIPYLNFIKRWQREEEAFYGLWLGNFPPDVYLDDFKIRTSNSAVINKLEIIKGF
ncbi:MAG: hypothetical protein KKH93_05025 [Candidatus Omnitrophica bacterium]|nr:hypothetical protein [Candidatus Omnitrophota bacterium]MBU2043758.1 hypothetical protein [Candidatus Omnitrophota bacterium]MBU2473841.1 hypothetical protein [Candidatus Omnitrophota bacterium]